MTIGAWMPHLAFFGAEVGIEQSAIFGDFKGLLAAGHLMVGDGGLDVESDPSRASRGSAESQAEAGGRPYAGLDLRQVSK